VAHAIFRKEVGEVTAFKLSAVVTHDCFRQTKARKDFVLLTITLVVNFFTGIRKVNIEK